jgi:uncharacterized protein (TIGR00251 family)
MDWRRYDPARRRMILTLHVQPGARNSQLVGPHGDALKVKIAAPAMDNKANAALVEFLSVTLGIQKSVIAIRHGTAGRRKVVEIAGGPELAAKFEALVKDPERR